MRRVSMNCSEKRKRGKLIANKGLASTLAEGINISFCSFLSTRGFHSINFKLLRTIRETPTPKESFNLLIPNFKVFIFMGWQKSYNIATFTLRTFLHFFAVNRFLYSGITNGYDLAYHRFAVLKNENNANVIRLCIKWIHRNNCRS